MRYKTTIEVTTEAGNAYEAADIAGELLRGDVDAKADLRVKTSSVVRTRTVMALLAISLSSVVLGSIFFGTHYANKFANAQNRPITSYAIQPSFNMNSADIKDSSEFKKMWNKQQKDR